MKDVVLVNSTRTKYSGIVIHNSKTVFVLHHGDQSLPFIGVGKTALQSYLKNPNYYVRTYHVAFIEVANILFSIRQLVKVYYDL